MPLKPIDEKTLLKKLQQTWYQTIPVSEFMQITPLEFNTDSFSVTAPLAPNINLHQTMFAGSIYTLMTLTGWGMVWLQQQLAGVEGSIVLADAHIRYIAPISEAPVAKAHWTRVEHSVLQHGKRTRVPLTIELYCGDKVCAKFEAIFVSSPNIKA